MSALVIAPAAPPAALAPAPRFGWDVAARQWSWSPEMYRLYGYAPDAVEATTERVLGQLHPYDLHGWVDAMHAGMQLRELVVHEHRVVDRSGRSRPVLLVTYPAYGADGPMTRMDGLMLPLDEEGAADADESPELVLLVMSTFDLGQVAARALLRRCAPAPTGWLRHRLQVVSEDGLNRTPAGSLSHDVATALFGPASLTIG